MHVQESIPMKKKPHAYDKNTRVRANTRERDWLINWLIDWLMDWWIDLQYSRIKILGKSLVLRSVLAKITTLTYAKYCGIAKWQKIKVKAWSCLKISSCYSYNIYMVYWLKRKKKETADQHSLTEKNHVQINYTHA